MFNAARPGYAQPQGRGMMVTFPAPPLGSQGPGVKAVATAGGAAGVGAPGALGAGAAAAGGGIAGAGVEARAEVEAEVGPGDPAALLAADPSCLLRKEPKEGYMTTHEVRLGFL